MNHRAVLLRLGGLVLLMALSYTVALAQPVRHWYADADKLAHALAFAGVYAGLMWALRGWPWWVVALLAIGLGAAVEVHQMFLPGYTPSVGDWGADALGVAVAVVVHWGWMKWVNA